MSDRNFKLIGKYALVLAIFYIVEFAVEHVLDEFTAFLTDTYSMMMVSSWVPTLLMLALNVVTAMLVNIDRKTYNIPTQYVMLATVLYRPLGVCAFLLFAIYDRENDPPQ